MSGFLTGMLGVVGLLAFVVMVVGMVGLLVECAKFFRENGE